MNRLGFEGRKFEDQGHRKIPGNCQQPHKQVLLKIYFNYKIEVDF